MLKTKSSENFLSPIHTEIRQILAVLGIWWVRRFKKFSFLLQKPRPCADSRF